MKNKEILYGIIGFIIGVVLTFIIIDSRFNNGMMGGAGMMGSINATPSSPQVAQIKQEEAQGQKLLLAIQSNAKTCKDLSQDNFEKIGDYVMRQRVGSSEKHAVVDAEMEQMMGKDQNVQMHISLGENATKCSSWNNTPTNGTVMPMMNNASGQ